MNEQISIKDWIQSDLAKSLESPEDHAKWGMFEIVLSDRWYEKYGVADNLQLKDVFAPHEYTYTNKVYALGCESKDSDKLKRSMGKVLIALRESAIAVKVEGCAVGDGKLFIQSRTDICLNADNDFDDERYKIVWYGRIERGSPDISLTKL